MADPSFPVQIELTLLPPLTRAEPLISEEDEWWTPRPIRSTSALPRTFGSSSTAPSWTSTSSSSASKPSGPFTTTTVGTPSVLPSLITTSSSRPPFRAPFVPAPPIKPGNPAELPAISETSATVTKVVGEADSHALVPPPPPPPSVPVRNIVYKPCSQCCRNRNCTPFPIPLTASPRANAAIPRQPKALHKVLARFKSFLNLRLRSKRHNQTSSATLPNLTTTASDTPPISPHSITSFSSLAPLLPLSRSRTIHHASPRSEPAWQFHLPRVPIIWREAVFIPGYKSVQASQFEDLFDVAVGGWWDEAEREEREIGLKERLWYARERMESIEGVLKEGERVREWWELE